MRRCKIAPNSCKNPDKPCCRNCAAEYSNACLNHCENSPDRCGLSTNIKPVKSASQKTDWDEIYRLYKTGVSQRDIARQLGCGKSTVCGAIHKMEERGAEFE